MISNKGSVDDKKKMLKITSRIASVQARQQQTTTKK